MKKILVNSLLPTLLLVVLCVVVLGLALRGKPGNPVSDQLNSEYWKDEGPLELSPERGRFALMYSVIEDKSFQFSIPVAQFAAPDVAVSDGKFVSLFAPALSFLIMPGYLVGKILGAAQVGTFAVISLFAVLNVIFIRAIAVRLGAHPIAATIAGLLFLFATPAFPYAVSLYQHHVSTFLILSSIYVLLRWNNLKSLTYVWVACAFSIMLDNPNLFFMFPIGLFALGRLISWEETKQHLKLKLKVVGLLTLSVMVIPLSLFMYLNYLSYGNPFQLAGTVETGNETLALLANESDLTQVTPTSTISQPEEIEADDDGKSALRFFETRLLPNGFYTHFLSPDRGMRMYAPVMLLGFIGIFMIARHNVSFFRLLVAVVGMIILVYSLWGDPYGGWAFGSRYLIPAYALLSIGVAIFLTRFRHSLVVLAVVLILSYFSVFVNTIGAITSSRIPPQIQVLALEEVSGMRQRYTFTRGMEMLNNDQSKSFFYQTVGYRHFSAWQFAIGLMVLISTPITLMVVVLLLQENHFIHQVSTRKASKNKK